MTTRTPNCKCLICNKEIYKRPNEIIKNNNKVYCSNKCYGISCRKPKPCIVCGNEILASKHRITCSRSCSNKNRSGIKYTGSRKKDKAKSNKTLKKRLIEERGSKCQICEYSIEEVLVTHHIIERSNGGTNDMQNLLLICPNCHGEIHYTEEGRALVSQAVLKTVDV